MVIFKEAKALRLHLEALRKKGVSIGFVPTMGALHAGHLSLIDRSKMKGDYTVCSIFVNPTQFNNPDDFKHYPITTEKDLELLLTSDCDCLFLPDKSEIYSSAYQQKQYDLGNLEMILEGAYRPGHFQGVCQVMDRLLEIVTPHHLFMGQKDYQQCMVIQRLLELTGRNNIQLEIVPTQREEDGLAMSSRNLRLSLPDRQKVPLLFQTLSFIKDNLPKQSYRQLEERAAQKLEAGGFTVDYVAIRNAHTLQIPNGKSEPLVALTAATINGIRLIDNLPLN